MSKLAEIACLVALGTGLGFAQTSEPVLHDRSESQPRVKVFSVGADVSAPELIPSPPQPIAAGKCKDKFKGNTLLSFVVDPNGKPRRILFLRPHGTDFDKLAIQLLESDLFKPGTHNGGAVAVADSVEVEAQACYTNSDTADRVMQFKSRPVQRFRPLQDVPVEALLAAESDGRTQRVGKGITPPRLLFHVEATFTEAARRARYEGNCIVSLIVDSNGMPEKIRAERKLDFGLTEQAIEAVSHYRFQPAMSKGEPVPVYMSVEISFHLF
jgi:outer membrane biosynthesis protein TonB